MPLKTSLSAAVLAALLAAGTIRAGEPPTAGVVCHIKVLSDKAEDVTTLEDWKKAYIKDGMTDEQKALAIWQTVVKYRYQCAPPKEFLCHESDVHDPMKTIHVYGYGMCCCAASNFEGLARYIGLQTRGRMIDHSVPEAFYDNAWHLFDPSLVEYHVKADGKIASVDEICEAVTSWHAKNPGYAWAENKLREFAANKGWKKGPELLATCKFYDDNGIGNDGWHGWPTSMGYYLRPKGMPPPYEFSPSMGYELNIQLREGEKLTRNWSNKGLFVPSDNSAPLNGRPNGLACQAKLGDLAPGRIGNGTLEYHVPLASGAFAAGALKVDNLAWTASDKAKPAVHVGDAKKPGQLIIRMPCSYLYLAGELQLSAVVGEGGAINVAFSDNHGLDWKPVAAITKTGEQKIDLKPFCYLRYDYRLKFDFSGPGTGLDVLAITHDLLHSQAPLPILTEGENKITFAAGKPEGTLTLEGKLDADPGTNLYHMAYHPALNNIAPALLRVQGRGDATYTLNTPGDLSRLRVNLCYRARDKNDFYEVQVGCGDSADFKTIEKLEGPTAGNSKYFAFADIPAGTNQIKLRLSGKEVNTTCMLDMRLDADYKEPKGGFRPVKITYVWDEGGAVKKDEHIARTANDSYTIKCGPKTVCKSVALELAE